MEKNLRVVLALFLACSSAMSFAAWDVYKSGLSVNGGYYDCQLDGVSPNFHNNYFGRYTSSGSLTIGFAEMLTYKNGSSNACGGSLKYRVYRTCDSAPAFSSLALGFCCNFGGVDCAGGACGPDVNNPGDQKWKGTPGAAISLLSGLTSPGTYVIEVYFEATGSTSNSSGCEETKYSSNGGVNYRAYFEYDINDSFSDSNFSTPTWGGDNANFTVAANSTTSGLTGSEAARTHTAKLNVSSTAGSDYISTQIATWDAQQEWYFWVGRDGTGGAPSDLDANNQQAIYLYANESNLESATVDGYRILLGQSGTSFIRLQRIDNGTATTIFTSSTGIPTSLTDYGITFKVTRSQLGVWTVRTSTLPTNSIDAQATPTPNSCPESLSTVNHGGTTDNTYVPASNGYFGFLAVHDNTAEGGTAAEFDQFRFLALPPNTYVAINGASSGSIAENATLANNYSLGVNIFNASATTATSVQLVLVSGTTSRGGGGIAASTAYAAPYSAVTLTWAAGESGTKYIYIDPANNTSCDDIATWQMQLQNASGGTNAFVDAANDDFTLSIVDDDSGYETLISDNFNDGNVTGWSNTGSAWTASTSSPLDGTHSAKHDAQVTSGQTSLSYPTDEASLSGLNTTWRFEVGFANDASANNNFQVFLSASDSNLYAAGINGYAVVVDQSSLPSAGTADYIRLYRVDNGVYAATPIVGSTTDWIDNVNGGTRVGFQVTLSDAGTWTLSVDANGGFDALSSLGSGTDLTGGALTYADLKYFGIRFKYLTTPSGFMRFDNVSLQQSGCRRLWYSQGTGNSNTAIWSSQPVGAATAVTSSRYDRFVVQSGHTITATGSWTLNDISVNSGGTLVGGSSSMRVYGNWVNEGSFTAQTSTVQFKGQAAQSIGFSTNAVNTTFFNLTIDNDGNAVTIDSAAVNVTGVVSLREGTLQTQPGTLTLTSNSTGSSSIGAIASGASISGNVILQRWIPSIPNVQGYWVNLGCPLQGQTLAAWNDDIVTSGFTGSDYPSYPFNNISYYDETLPGAMNAGWVSATNISNAIQTNRGYFVWLNGSQQNIDNTGTIQSGNITHTLNYTVTSPGGIFDYGWNLMTNPYPSEVDWNLVSASLTGPKVYYVYDYQTSSYKFRNAATNTGTASRYIPHSQSFLVKVNASGQSLQFQESYKTNVGIAFERSGDDQNAFLSLQIAGNGAADEGLILFDPTALSVYDEKDALDIPSPIQNVVQFSFVSADDASLIQYASAYTEGLTIPVMLNAPMAGVYTLSVPEAMHLPLGACLQIEDVVTGSFYTLVSGMSFDFEVAAPYQGIRFIIHGHAAAELISSSPSCPGEHDGSIDISTPAGSWNVSLSNSQSQLQFVSNGAVTFDHLAAGTYLLELSSDNAACGTSSIEVTLQDPPTHQLHIKGAQEAVCQTNELAAISFSVEHASWFTYSLTDYSGAVVREGTVEGDHFTLEGLEGDLYTLEVDADCFHASRVIDLRGESTPYVQVESSVEANYIVGQSYPLFASTNASHVVWEIEYLNAQSEWTSFAQLEGFEVTFTPTIPGLYRYLATATLNGCAASDEAILNVGLISNIANMEMLGARILQSDEMITVLLNETPQVSSDLVVTDAMGRVIHSESANKSTIQMMTNSWAAGVYFIRLVNEGKSTTLKKVIVH